MAIKLKPSRTYKTTVDFKMLDENGKEEKQNFEAEFKRLTSAEVKALWDANTVDKDFAETVLVGWKLVDADTRDEVPFTPENVNLLLQNVPGLAYTIVLKFNETLGLSLAKN